MLLKDETAASKTYRLARICKIFPSTSDGHVRQVLVKYKNQGEKVFRTSERPIQGLVLILPVEEQSEWGVVEDLRAEAKGGSGKPGGTQSIAHADPEEAQIVKMADPFIENVEK